MYSNIFSSVLVCVPKVGKHTEFMTRWVVNKCNNKMYWIHEFKYFNKWEKYPIFNIIKLWSNMSWASISFGLFWAFVSITVNQREKGLEKIKNLFWISQEYSEQAKYVSMAFNVVISYKTWAVCNQVISKTWLLLFSICII